MKTIGKMISEKGIALIVLIVIILISVAIISMVVKGIFDNQSIGATDIKEDEGYLIRKICKIHSG